MRLPDISIYPAVAEAGDPQRDLRAAHKLNHLALKACCVRAWLSDYLRDGDAGMDAHVHNGWACPKCGEIAFRGEYGWWQPPGWKFKAKAPKAKLGRAKERIDARRARRGEAI